MKLPAILLYFATAVNYVISLANGSELEQIHRLLLVIFIMVYLGIRDIVIILSEGKKE